MIAMRASRYREEFLLGVGGMAEVWKAEGPQGPVAIKRLLPHAARNPSIAAAFEREGRLLLRITHPNVIRIHEVARDEQGTSLVLEYVEGADLTRVAGERVATPVALRVLRDLLNALVGVHSLGDDQGRPLGLIHRDLSLANLLVDMTGRVRLTDFGLARAVSGSHAATTGQNIKGTLAYLAPEQARGAPVDARTDLFAAGAILYELLAGAPIYDDDDPRIALARARAGDVQSLAAARADAPLPLVEFVDRALAAEPSDRFPNAEIMLRELERVADLTCGLADDDAMSAWARSYLAHAGIPAPPSTAKSTTGRRSIVVYGSMLVLSVIGSVAAWRWRRDDQAKLVEIPLASTETLAATAVVETSPSGVTSPEPFPPSSAPHETDNRPARKSRGPVAPSAQPHEDRPNHGGSKEKCILDIGSEPAYAYVAIDGVKVGPTPIFGRAMTPGTHRIQVWRDGLGSKTFSLEMRPGDRITRVVKLP
jgi:serine/threonine-protein kinase